MKLTPTMQVILQTLELHGPMTIPQICDEAKLKYRSLYNTSPNALERLRLGSLVHVAHWQPSVGNGGLPKPAYAYGPGEDAEYPGKQSIELKRARNAIWQANHRLQKKLQKQSMLSILLGTNPNMRRTNKGGGKC